MKPLHISHSKRREAAKNTAYPYLKEVKTLDDLKFVAQFDHLTGITSDPQRRGNDFFRCTDFIAMDCDNDHSDNAQDWITPERLAEGEFKDVEFCIVYSRNHMKVKGKFSERTRFHIYFPLRKVIENADEAAAFKEKLLNYFPYFDAGAKDALRLLFGVVNPQVAIFNEDKNCVDEIPLPAHTVPAHTDTHSPKGQKKHSQAKTNTRKKAPEITTLETIPEGKRHEILLSIACSLWSKYPPDVARIHYEAQCAMCETPLPLEEQEAIWKDARKFIEEHHSLYGRGEKKHLSPANLEQVLESLAIAVRLNSITGNIEIRKLPHSAKRNDNDCKEFEALIPNSFKRQQGFQRSEEGFATLYHCLIPFLKDRGYKFTHTYLTELLTSEARNNRYNPILEAIIKKSQQARRDGDDTDRIKELQEILHCNNEDMHFVKKWLVQAVAMLHNECGDKNNDFVLCLQGAQGIGKTLFFRKLAIRPEYFVEGATIDMRNKDSIIHAISCWICEIGEVDSTMKKEQSDLKGFLTATSDKIRLPYERKEETKPRKTVFGATVNPERFLRDDTGSRRFVIISVKNIDIERLRNLNEDWFLGLWAQVYDSYLQDKGRDLWRLTRDEIQRNDARNADAQVPLQGEQEILEGLDWDSKVEDWTFRQTADIQKELELKISLSLIGKAISRLMTRNPKIKKVRTSQGAAYLLPLRLTFDERMYKLNKLKEEEEEATKNYVPNTPNPLKLDPDNIPF